MFYPETVEEGTLNLLRQLQELPLLRSTRLVWGTSLSLQIGHRVSEDLDLFSNENLDIKAIESQLKQEFGFVASSVSHGSIMGRIDGVKLDIMKYRYPWLEEPVSFSGTKLASSNATP